MVITASPDLPFSSFPPAATPFADTKLGISFETREQMDDSLSLLRFNCPLPTCDTISLGWSDLKRHAHADHASSLCDLCCSFKKIFSHEHTLYSGKELVKHKQSEHMTCDFCNIGFYDSDALYAHCRDRHEECFICVRHGIRHQYHRNYDRLVRTIKILYRATTQQIDIYRKLITNPNIFFALIRLVSRKSSSYSNRNSICKLMPSRSTVQLCLEIKERGEMPEGLKRISVMKRKRLLEDQQGDEDRVGRMEIRQGTVERRGLQLLHSSRRTMARRELGRFRG